MANLFTIQSLIDIEIERLQRMAAMLAANAAIDGRVQCLLWAGRPASPRRPDVRSVELWDISFEPVLPDTAAP